MTHIPPSGAIPSTALAASVPQTAPSGAAWTCGRPLAPVLVVMSHKGGTGKSTVSVNLAVALAAAFGLRVTHVDIDPQPGSSFVGVPPVDDPFAAPPVMQHGIRLYASGEALAGASPDEVADHVTRARVDTDLVIVDVRGTRDDGGHLARLLELPNVRVLGVPAAEPRSLPEISKLVHDVAATGRDYRILVNRVMRRRISRDVVDALRVHFGNAVLEAWIPERADVWAAEERCLPVVLHRPTAAVSQAICQAAAELRREGLV